MENMNTGNTQPQVESNSDHQTNSVPYLEIDRGFIAFNRMNLIEVENVLIKPQDNPPL